MKRYLKGVALMLTLLLAMGAFAGCLPKASTVAGTEDSSPASSGPASAPADNASSGTDAAAPAEPPKTLATPMDLAERTPQTLEVWYAVSGTSGEKFVEQAKAFDAGSDLVSLNLSYSGGSNDTATKVSASLLTGTQPDVALMYAGPSYTGGRGDYSMSELIQREGFNADDIFPGMWDYCLFGNGGVCAVPYGISTQVLYYNKDILAAAGVDMTNPPKTWEEFYNVCVQCMEKGNINNTADFTAFDVTDTGWLFKSMLMQNGCPVVEIDDKDVITPVFNNAEALEVAEYWKKLVDSGVMAPSEHNVAENKFLSGNLAFVAMSSNRISRWTDVDINIGAIEMPYFKTQSLALGGSVIVILTQDPQRVEAAWDFIHYMLAPEQNVDFALSTGYLPVRQSELTLPAVQDAIAKNEMYNVAFKQLSYTWAYVHFEQMGTMDLQIADALSRIEKGVLAPQEALDRALNRLLDEIAADQ